MAIIRDIGLTLRKLLTSISELDESLIVFNSPSDIQSTDGRRLSVFLYQIVENNYLRNIGSEPVGLDRMQNPPLVLDLYYIFTPYDADREIELIILEKLMQVFHDNPVPKGDNMLEGSLKGSGAEIRVVPDNLTFEEINKLWERFPNRPYKLSASYILTPVRIPSAKEPIKVTRIIEKDIDLYRKEAKI